MPAFIHSFNHQRVLLFFFGGLDLILWILENKLVLLKGMEDKNGNRTKIVTAF
jgi:Gpi18-like mannosyltransferase